jgi:hypothetical protein
VGDGKEDEAVVTGGHGMIVAGNWQWGIGNWQREGGAGN